MRVWSQARMRVTVYLIGVCGQVTRHASGPEVRAIYFYVFAVACGGHCWPSSLLSASSVPHVAAIISQNSGTFFRRLCLSLIKDEKPQLNQAMDNSAKYSFSFDEAYALSRKSVLSRSLYSCLIRWNRSGYNVCIPRS